DGDAARIAALQAIRRRRDACRAGGACAIEGQAARVDFDGTGISIRLGSGPDDASGSDPRIPIYPDVHIPRVPTRAGRRVGGDAGRGAGAAYDLEGSRRYLNR